MERKEIIKAKAPERKEKITLRLMISGGFLLLCCFVYWFIVYSNIGNPYLYWILTFALSYKLLKMIHEWYHYWDISVPPMPEQKTPFTVDILTTYCAGEPKGMIKTTLLAMKEVRYPHNNYLCDEADDQELKEFCKQHGIFHVTRIIKNDAKAGNINNALQQATGDLCVVMDPDHVPIPEFLDRVVPYFEDEEIGYVQIVQAYSNQDESLIALGAAEQTYHFYGPMMMCMNSYGTVQAIGANCTFRRKALDSIGGHAAGLSEDMHTAMRIHAAGWKSIYVPEVLTKGLVPATLSAFYKQQLKWSRGTFDLLFHVVPGLFKKFTWRQKLHYLTIPFYFLSGIVTFFDILIPLLALISASVPWETDVLSFTGMFVPLIVMSLLIRQYAQRWLLEKHERGFQLMGGIMRYGTWWIYLTGLIYTFLKIKVPYIPTPKNDEHVNNIKLSMPNCIACILCLLSIGYGLHRDLNPYSLIMAGFAFTNAFLLGFVVVIGQEKLLVKACQWISTKASLSTFLQFLHTTFFRVLDYLYMTFRHGAIAYMLLMASIFLGYSIIDNGRFEEELTSAGKELGGFYLGFTANDPALVGKQMKAFKKIPTVVKTKIGLRQLSGIRIQLLLGKVKKYNAIPLLSIELDSARDFKSIYNGFYDQELLKIAGMFRSFKDPIFIEFAPYVNDPSCPYFLKGDSAAETYRDAWRYAFSFFNKNGISNLSWVYNLDKTKAALKFYPGDQYADWLSITTMGKGKNFASWYRPYRYTVLGLKKPLMLNGLDVTKDSAFAHAVLNNISNFEEIKGLVICGDDLKKDHLQDINTLMLSSKKITERPYAIDRKFFCYKQHKYQSPFVNGTPGNYFLQIDGKPFYIRGIAYNTGHDWRDGNMPLTRRQIEKDFSQIKEMGGNCIRRYDHGLYDHNILNIAAEKDMKVLYGFWYDPKIDYCSDSLKVQEYINTTLSNVEKLKDKQAILAWVVGNETWGQLKHYYAKPYLVKVREGYLEMLDQLAKRIHKIDPTRPVISAIEHDERQTPGELTAFHDDGIHFDVIGINSYYRQQISQLNDLVAKFDSTRPYLVSEFGSNGYWNPFFNLYRGGLIKEQNDKEKASWFREQWTRYVEKNRGNNVGGVVYCWHDRMEGSNTWFGLTDFEGHLKPSYYALKDLWRGSKQQGVYFTTDIKNLRDKYFVNTNYLFKASVDIKRNFHYKWVFQNSKDYKNIKSIKIYNDGKLASVHMPEVPGMYRLYLYAFDNRGNVSTISYFIPVIQRNPGKIELKEKSADEKALTAQFHRPVY